MEVDDVPVLRLVDRRQASQQRHISSQDDDRLGARLTQHPAITCAQLRAEGARRRWRLLR
jgi:hypothetical protein